MYGKNQARLQHYGGECALVMPYCKSLFRPDDDRDPSALPQEQINSVKEAIKAIAAKGYMHNDLKWDHIGTISPNRKSGYKAKQKPYRKNIIIFDLASISEMDPLEAETSMMRKLHLDEEEEEEEAESEEQEEAESEEQEEAKFYCAACHQDIDTTVSGVRYHCAECDYELCAACRPHEIHDHDLLRIAPRGSSFL